MKKFTKMLAMGMAMALIFGMTVSAASSVSTNSVTIVSDDVTAVSDFSSATQATVKTKVESAVSEVNKHLAASYEKVEYVGGFDLTIAENAVNATVTIQLSGIVAGKSYAVIHFNADYTIKQVLKATNVANGTLTVSGVNGGSPFAVVELLSDDSDDDDDNDSAVETTVPTSPKTGETIPVAGILAVICLAGAAVCVRKVRYNR